MKYYLFPLLLLILSTNAISQKVTPLTDSTDQHYKFDVYPVFPKNNGDVGTYIVKHIKKTDTIIGNLKTNVFIYLDIDSAGKAIIKSISPNKYPDINEAFEKVVSDLPGWQPATLNGKPVKSFYSLTFFVEMNKDKSSMYVERFPRLRQSKNTGETIYNAVEVNPSFPGGEGAFDQYLRDHTKYPEAASLRRVSGPVFVQMVIEKDGSLSNLIVLRDPGYGLGDEALRLLCIGPKWKPGMQNGKPVRVLFTVPIRFFFKKTNRH